MSTLDPQAHVAVVAPDPAQRDALTVLIRTLGYRATPLCGAGATYQLIATLQPDLVLLAPGAGGERESIAHLAADPRTRGIPVLLWPSGSPPSDGSGGTPERRLRLPARVPRSPASVARLALALDVGVRMLSVRPPST